MHQWWAMPTLPLHATASGNRGTFSLVPAYPDFRDPHTNTLIHIMNGLHIIHQTKCDFGLFFKPIMSILDQFHWIWEYENTLCNTNLLDAEQLAEYHEMLASLETYGAYRVYIPPGTIFSKYSDKIPNDWCDIYGFSKKPDCENFTQRLDEAKEADNANLTCKIEELLCQGFSDNYDDIAPQGERRRNSWLEQNVDLCFFNVDGSFWNFYAKDQTLIKMVANYLTTLPEEITMEKVTLAKWDL